MPFSGRPGVLPAEPIEFIGYPSRSSSIGSCFSFVLPQHRARRGLADQPVRVLLQQEPLFYEPFRRRPDFLDILLMGAVALLQGRARVARRGALRSCARER